MADVAPAGVPVLDLGPEPASRREWLRELWAFREVLVALARKDFKTRYKRARLGLVWAVIVPLVQGAIMALVFSKVIRVGTGTAFGAYVLSGIMAWSYFAATLSVGTSSVVDGAGMAEKVWFPRAVVVLVPALANVVGLVISYAVLILLLPFLDVSLGPELLLLVPAMLLLVAFVVGLSLVLSALYVYFRDVRFLVQAALLVWLYVTPIIYFQEGLAEATDYAGLLDLNPMTGVVEVFRMATVGSDGDWVRAVAVAVVTTVVLLLAGAEAHRRHDRLFVDQL